MSSDLASNLEKLSLEHFAASMPFDVLESTGLTAVLSSTRHLEEYNEKQRSKVDSTVYITDKR